MTMRKKTDKLTDFDKQLIAGMEEVVAHINGAPDKGRVTVVEFADAKAIREGLGMSQAARLPPTYGRLRNSLIKSAKLSSVTRCGSRPRSSNDRGYRGSCEHADSTGTKRGRANLFNIQYGLLSRSKSDRRNEQADLPTLTRRRDQTPLPDFSGTPPSWRPCALGVRFAPVAS
jgi:hypothetical protein